MFPHDSLFQWNISVKTVCNKQKLWVYSQGVMTYDLHLSSEDAWRSTTKTWLWSQTPALVQQGDRNVQISRKKRTRAQQQAAAAGVVTSTPTTPELPSHPTPGGHDRHGSGGSVSPLSTVQVISGLGKHHKCVRVPDGFIDGCVIGMTTHAAPVKGQHLKQQNISLCGWKASVWVRKNRERFLGVSGRVSVFGCGGAWQLGTDI